jgi:hypothetical protein
LHSGFPDLKAQTANSGVISGTVTDAAGAVVPGVVVQSVEAATGIRHSATANEAGQYVFLNVASGRYTLTVSKPGFRDAELAELVVEVAKSYVQNFTLEVGEINQSIQVTATAAVELQTADATIGNVLAGRSLLLLPTFTRDANELLTLQPGVTPGKPGSPGNYGVTGALRDQSTTTLDGLDVSNMWGDPNTFLYLGAHHVVFR